MADAGIGEAMLISAAIGGGSSAIQGRDPLQGALLGGALGGLGYGAMGALGGAGGTVPGAVDLGGAGYDIGAFASGASGAGANAAEMIPGAIDLGGAGYDIGAFSAPGAVPGTAGATAQASNWYDPFFKAGGPNTGGITDFWKSMNLAGQAGTAGLGSMAAKELLFPKVKVPGKETYSGPLSRFRYNPDTYTPYTPTPPNPAYRAQYAGGGITALAQGGGLNNPTGPVERLSQQVVGAGGMYPQSQMDKTYFATPTQMPASAEVIGADYDARTNPYTGVMMASGGIAGLREGSFVVPADVVSHMGNGSTDAGIAALRKHTGAKPIRGGGDGMSDSIPTSIDGRQEARVADGEAVIEPEQVKRIGKGSAKTGAKKLYSMMDKVRKARTGNAKQGRQINPAKYMPA